MLESSEIYRIKSSRSSRKRGTGESGQKARVMGIYELRFSFGKISYTSLASYLISQHHSPSLIKRWEHTFKPLVASQTPIDHDPRSISPSSVNNPFCSPDLFLSSQIGQSRSEVWASKLSTFKNLHSYPRHYFNPFTFRLLSESLAWKDHQAPLRTCIVPWIQVEKGSVVQFRRHCVHPF